MLTARLPSDELTAPPVTPTFIMVGAPPGGLPVPPPPPPPQPKAASVSVNEQRIDVWTGRMRIGQYQSARPSEN
jgi:hypothetical protein